MEAIDAECVSASEIAPWKRGLLLEALLRQLLLVRVLALLTLDLRLPLLLWRLEWGAPGWGRKEGEVVVRGLRRAGPSAEGGHGAGVEGGGYGG